MLGEKARGYCVLFARQRAHLPVNRLHALHRQQLERQGDGEICLFCFEPAGAQEPREIRRRRIRRVELRHRRNDRQNAHFGHVRKYIALGRPAGLGLRLGHGVYPTPEEKARVYAEVRTNSVALRKLGEGDRVTRNVKCPFLNEGRCAIYETRPESCRNYHATNVAGCQQSYEEPENLDIDSDFAPGLYQAGGAHVEAVSTAMCDAGDEISELGQARRNPLIVAKYSANRRSSTM